MSLLPYWPSVKNIDQCINTEAETASEATLLAVHRETPLSRQQVGSPEPERIDEQSLFDFFTSPNVPSGTLVLPITGDSGVGKSHLIRLMDARLRHSEDAHRYAVIRIPKSASLRQVIKLILNELSDKRHENVRKEFLEPFAGVSQEDAAIRFRGELEISLREYARQIEEQLRGNPTDRLLRQKLDHARRFPLLLNDPAFAPHFSENVLPRIVTRSVSGRHAIEEEDEFEEVDAKFKSEHIESIIDVDLTEASREAGSYLLTLRSKDGAGIPIAIDVLNEVVDRSIQRLYQLQLAKGGMTFEEVILEIRRRLLKEGRELVLLVEDFVALVGIQDALAQVIIRQGVSDGRQEFATMRSAIAVTEGHLLHRETILTRAHYTWRVESELDDEGEVLNRANSLVAAYLNAARWGESEIFRHYHGYESGANSQSWLPVFDCEIDTESESKLEQFDVIDGISLFPFTKKAVNYLAREALRKGTGLVFNPRYVINNILRKILLSGRSDFEQERFPNNSLTKRQLRGQIAEWLAKLPYSSSDIERLRTLILVWGENPSTLADVASIPRAVFEAFGLPAPDLDSPVDNRPSVVVSPPPNDPTPTEDPDHETVRLIEEALEDWANGVELSQDIANDIRGALSDELKSLIDWNAELVKGADIQRGEISIPNARGEGRYHPVKIIIAPDHVDSDGRIRAELLSLLRLDHFRNKDIYDGKDNDLIRVDSLTERLLPQALQIIRNRTHESVSAALWALLDISRILGVSSTRGQLRDIERVMSFEPSPNKVSPTSPEAFQKWGEVQNSASTVRGELLELIFAGCGCFRGTGSKVYGLDMYALSEYIKNRPNDVSVPQGKWPAELRSQVKKLVGVQLLPTLRKVVGTAKAKDALIRESLGDDIEKDELVRELKTLAELLRESGMWPSSLGMPTTRPFLQSMENFRQSPFSMAQKTIRQLFNEEITGDQTQIEIIGQVSLDAFQVALEFAEMSAKLMQQVEKDIEAEQATLSTENLQTARGKMSELLARTVESLTDVQESEK